MKTTETGSGEAVTKGKEVVHGKESTMRHFPGQFYHLAVHRHEEQLGPRRCLVQVTKTGTKLVNTMQNNMQEV